MQNLVKAIQIINPEAEFSIDADLKITWLGSTEPILQEEIDQKIDQAKYQIGIERLRAERNAKLIETDYLTIPDRPTSISDEMKSYRQELRDLPSQYTSFNDFPVVWPTQPSD
jgi:hypothetical protein